MSKKRAKKVSLAKYTPEEMVEIEANMSPDEIDETTGTGSSDSSGPKKQLKSFLGSAKALVESKLTSGAGSQYTAKSVSDMGAACSALSKGNEINAKCVVNVKASLEIERVEKKIVPLSIIGSACSQSVVTKSDVGLEDGEITD